MFSALLLSALVVVQAAPAPGMTINVQKLPANFAQNPVVHLEFDKGEVSTCAVKQSSGNAGIDKVACQQAQAQVKFPKKKHQKLEPMDMVIAFVAAAAPAPAQ